MFLQAGWHCICLAACCLGEGICLKSVPVGVHKCFFSPGGWLVYSVGAQTSRKKENMQVGSQLYVLTCMADTYG